MAGSRMVCAVARIGLATAGVALLAGGSYASEPLPSATFRLGCVADVSNRAAEIESIRQMLAFAQAHDGSAVYLDIAVEADSGSGVCSRDLGGTRPRRLPQDWPLGIWFNGCRQSPGGSRCIRAGMVQIDADGPPLAYRHSIVVPRPDQLPDGLPYRIGGYGDWLSYRGPFIVRHHEGTGYAYATFHVPDPALAPVWQRAACNAGACE